MITSCFNMNKQMNTFNYALLKDNTMPFSIFFFMVKGEIVFSWIYFWRQKWNLLPMSVALHQVNVIFILCYLECLDTLDGPTYSSVNE